MRSGELEIRLNGDLRRVQAGTVGRLLGELGYSAEGRGIAVARNGAIVPRQRWPHERLADGDELEIVGAVQGG